MAQRGHNLHTRHEGSQRHTATQRLRQTDDIGRNAILHAGKHLARTAKTRLYLIEYQQRTHLVATLAQRFEEALSGQTHTCLTLHRLDQNGCRTCGNTCKLLEIIKLQRLHIGQQRSECSLPLLTLGRTHHTHRSVCRAVVSTSERDQLRTTRISLSQLQRALDRLGTRIEKIDTLQRCRQQLGNTSCILHLRSLDQLAIDHHVHIARRLLLHSLNHHRIAMAHIADRHTRHKVEIALTLRRIETRALGTLHLDQHWRGRGLSHVLQKLFTQNHIFNSKFKIQNYLLRFR